jgi:hypothetical protein
MKLFVSFAPSRPTVKMAGGPHLTANPAIVHRNSWQLNYQDDEKSVWRNHPIYLCRTESSVNKTFVNHFQWLA